MDGLSLLDRAAAAGLQIILVGDDLAIRGPRSCADLVAEIRAHKPEVAAALAARAEADPAAWETLSAQRWGGADDSPGIEITREPWEMEVDDWPMGRWLAWQRHAVDLAPPGASAKEVRAARRRAYDELKDEGRPPPEVGETPVAEQPEPAPGHNPSPEAAGFEPIAGDDAPAWVDDESLTIRTADVRAAVDHHRAQLAAEARLRPAGRGRPASSPKEAP